MYAQVCAKATARLSIDDADKELWDDGTSFVLSETKVRMLNAFLRGILYLRGKEKFFRSIINPTRWQQEIVMLNDKNKSEVC